MRVMGRPKDPGKLGGVTVRLPAEVVRQVDALAEAQGTTRGQVVRRLVLAGLGITTRPSSAPRLEDAGPSPSNCRHPINRRIGKLCAECGGLPAGSGGSVKR